MKAISVIAAAGVAAGFLLTSAGAATKGGSISLVAYSTPKEAYGQLISAFQKTKAGKGVGFTQSYGPSGDQAQAVVNGLHADVVGFSLAPDVTTLVKAHLVSPSWDKNRWNVMAAYGAMRRKGKTDKQAIAYLNKLFHHVVSQDKSAREALQTFLAGRGDVMLAYENEAILAQRKGQPVYYLIPKATIRIENPVAVTKSASPAARAFVAFLHSAKGQTIFGQNGYRPVMRSVVKKFNYPVRPWLFTIQKLGGWAKVEKRFFDPKSGVMAKIEAGLGK